MSGVRAAQSVSPQPKMPGAAEPNADVQAMQDILYDILADGMDPERADVPTQAVERFLFEHARSPKSREEFRAFFSAHGLSLGMRPASEAPLSLPPIQRPNADAGMPVQLPVELAVASRAPDPVRLAPPAPVPAWRRPAILGLWAAVALVTSALLALTAYGFRAIVELKADLRHEAQQGRDDRQELKALRDHAVGLESSVAATGELVERVEQKSDLLIESLLPPPSTHAHKK